MRLAIGSLKMAMKYRKGDWFYKENHAFLITNEIWFLEQMADTGYVPRVERIGDYKLRTEWLGNQTESWKGVTDCADLLRHERPILQALKDRRIRHGDLSEYAIIARDNRPFLIDFAESRLWDDPRPDKRPQGDAHWLHKSLLKICHLSTTVEHIDTGK